MGYIIFKERSNKTKDYLSMRNIFSDLYVACLKLKVQTDILTLR